eukprot:TRINITY_DN40488_c0_g1_i2.p4 TRINITY_DN40488_c0_g1~~TRINITY_DN40488_c0_g1_i2.p4  ORF type:complete len:213 (+),score=52.21 TRINITY_DN40488_c0_g1_i2:907-1545(+)
MYSSTIFPCALSRRLHAPLHSAMAVRSDGVAVLFLRPFTVAALPPQHAAVVEVRFPHPQGEVRFALPPGAAAGCGQLEYTVAGEPRPPVTELCWDWAAGQAHGWLVMPGIGKRVEPPLGGLAELLGRLRALAAFAAVSCDIPPQPRIGLPAAKRLLFAGADASGAAGSVGNFPGLVLAVEPPALRRLCAQRAALSGGALARSLEDVFAGMLS